MEKSSFSDQEVWKKWSLSTVTKSSRIAYLHVCISRYVHYTYRDGFVYIRTYIITGMYVYLYIEHAQYSTVQYSTIQYSSVQYSTVQLSTA